VRWHKHTPYTFNIDSTNDLKTWSDEFEEMNSSRMLPVQRIYRPVGVMKWLEQKKVNVIIPMSKKNNRVLYFFFLTLAFFLCLNFYLY
jgi:hypothetical protein